MAEVASKNWYVIRAVSGQEAKIKDYIMGEISRLGYADTVLSEVVGFYFQLING
jgi:transcriptional antiterminator NusG